MLIVLCERNGGVYLVRLAHYVCLDAEPVECRERLAVKLGDRFGHQRDSLMTAVTVPDCEPMPDEVELHVEQRIPIWNGAGSQSAWADIERHLPPMVQQRHVNHADLADNLDPHVQGVTGGRPVVDHQGRPVPRGALHVVSSPSSPSVRLNPQIPLCSVRIGAGSGTWGISASAGI